jgi:hypothetical protein
MLKLIGAIIVILLVIGPVLVRAGVTDQAGLLTQFVDLETRFFVDLVDAVRNLWNHYA